ncbi:hypothetical protein L7F22_052315, partial [Adiantum nelumboides]|nr:hypothetical protein [Adiantum nelumboides]
KPEPNLGSVFGLPKGQWGVNSMIALDLMLSMDVKGAAYGLGYTLYLEYEGVSFEADNYKEKSCSVNEGRSPPASGASSQEFETDRVAPAVSGAGNVPPSIDGEPIASSSWLT